jgi:hypothetical protein
MKCQLGNEKCKCTLKERLRKVFTDHVIYTKSYIESYFSEDGPETKFILKRLLRNQLDIGKELQPKIGKDKAQHLTKLLREHIVLAGNVIASVKNHNDLQKPVEAVFENSRKVAEFLTSLNPERLPFKVTHKMFDTHNKQVLILTELHEKGKFEKEVKLFDHYLQHMLQLSDAIAYALDSK